MKNIAIQQIHEEHRALGAVVHGLLHFAREAVRARPDLPLLGTMLDYIEQFPQKLHHVKEETYIFSTLRARCTEAAALLERLQAQHADDLALTAALRSQLRDLAAGAEGAAERFHAGADRFADLQWRHMTEEERLLLPLAEKHLDDADWKRIGDAFGENGDPRFRGDDKSRFDEMFRLIVSTAPPPIGLG